MSSVMTDFTVLPPASEDCSRVCVREAYQAWGKEDGREGQALETTVPTHELQ